MSIWVIRGGKFGEYENRFINESKVYLTREGFKTDLNKIAEQPDLRTVLDDFYPTLPSSKLASWSDQIWSFAHDIQQKDWIIVPSKLSPVLHVGEITGEYNYEKNNSDPYYHSRDIKWIEKDIPRGYFPTDILYQLGGFKDVFNADSVEKVFHTMADNEWAQTKDDETSYEQMNELIALLQEISRDQIAQLIRTKFKGHRLAKLVKALMEAKGYTTHMGSSDEAGSDLDILAARGGMGFDDDARICIQVKADDIPVATLDEFFRVRLWNQNDLIDQVLTHYEELDNYIKGEIPLKSFWTIASDLD